MSHFTVLVIGDNPEELLAPFDEALEVAPYEDDEVNPQDAVDWAKKSLTDPEVIARQSRPLSAEDRAQYQKISELDVSDEAQAREALAWYGDRDAVLKPDGRWIRMTTYNPKSKWDWYSLGGRWRGSLKLKDEALAVAAGDKSAALGELSYVFEPKWNDGKQHIDDVGWVDTCLVRDLDLAGMMAKKRAIGERAIANLVDFISEKGNPPSLEWLDKPHDTPGWQQEKDAFWQSPWVKEFDKLGWDTRSGPVEERYGLGLGMGGWWEFDDFRLVIENANGRDRFLMLQEARGIPGYALLDEEHGWMSPGEMGWFGMSSDDASSRIGFYEARMAIVTSLPEDTRLSVYDCHI